MVRHQAAQGTRRHTVRLPTAAVAILGFTWLIVGRSFSLWRPEQSDRMNAKSHFSERRQLLAGLGAAVVTPAMPALAFEAYKDPSGTWEFKYPTGLQKSESKLYNFFVRDLIEPLESVGVRVSPTTRKSLDEIGDANEVAKKLLEDTVPKGAPKEIIKAESKYDKEGRRTDIIEYAYQWKFDETTARAVGRQRFQLHSKALITIERKKQYLVLVSVEEPRWKNSGDLLGTAIDTFRLN